MSLGSIRTIFLFIRGVDQTGRALEGAKKKVETLEEAQQKLAKTSYRLMFAGAAFLTFGAMMARALAGVLEHTSRGVRLMGDFGTALDRVKQRLAETIIGKFGDDLTDLLKDLENLTEDDWKMNIIASLLFGTVEGLIKGGLVGLGVAFVGKIIGALATALSMAGMTATAATLTTVGGALLAIGIVAMATIVIGSIIWRMLPAAEREAVKNFTKKIKKLLSPKIPGVQEGYDILHYSDFFGPGVPTGHVGGASPAGARMPSPSTVEANIDVTVNGPFYGMTPDDVGKSVAEALEDATTDLWGMGPGE